MAVIKINYHITTEQQKFRDELLKKKPKKPRKTYRTRWSDVESELPPTREQYIKNCIYWIKEYEAGRVSIERCLSATANLRIYCEQIILEQKRQ